jgi:mannose-6-phosphate isomerase-like protein (cupin superfamily)
VLRPRDRRWRAVAPNFASSVDLARAGVPFQTAIDRRYDRSGRPRVLDRALREGRTIFFPQIHQVLPRLARLIVALRVGVLRTAGDECSYLFAVQGRGREGMGLHHDGEVDAVWLQLEGRRTVTIGPPVARRTPLDLPATLAHDTPGWRTFDLTPGTLFHLPPRTPHRVVCHGRSLAISLTWARARARAVTGRAAHTRALAAWDVVDGYVDAIPRASRDWLWVQIPVIPGPIDRYGRDFALWTDEGEIVRLPASLREWATDLAMMPALRRRDVPAAALDLLVRTGILASFDVPCVIRPARPRALDGWRFG